MAKKGHRERLEGGKKAEETARILVVDDMEAILRAYQEMLPVQLKDRGFPVEVISEQSPVAAIDALKKLYMPEKKTAKPKPVDVIVCDVSFYAGTSRSGYRQLLEQLDQANEFGRNQGSTVPSQGNTGGEWFAKHLAEGGVPEMKGHKPYFILSGGMGALPTQGVDMYVPKGQPEELIDAIAKGIEQNRGKSK